MLISLFIWQFHSVSGDKENIFSLGSCQRHFFVIVSIFLRQKIAGVRLVVNTVTLRGCQVGCEIGGEHRDT
ncbi:hypothetical protein BJV78DRAFT_1258592 [Lactifluus subvellereus]|nr:hypothetical protein BJV78DRAFT_1258592 [Lactifluus subvellereus]